MEPVEKFPPARLVGLAVNVARTAGVKFSVAVVDWLPSFAVTMAALFEVTPWVSILKLTFDCPAGTVTLDGTVTTVLLLDSAT
jgi:hypothetical protein